MKRLAFAFLGAIVVLLSCGPRSLNSKCLAFGESPGPDGYRCMAGLVCDTLQGGFEEKHGNTYYITGKCVKPKKAGERCMYTPDCESPLQCAREQPVSAYIASGTALPPGVCFAKNVL
jgi:hypothetical protein